MAILLSVIVLGTGVEVGLGTTAPVYWGAHAQVELPHRLQLRGEIGWMPSGYVSLINDGAMAFNAYDEVTAELIQDSLEDSLVVRIGAGVRLFEELGLELHGGYTHASLGGGASTLSVLEAVVGRSFNLQGASASEVDIQSTLHAFHLEATYRWLIDEHWVLRAGVGYVHVVRANTLAELETTSTRFRSGGTQRVEAFEDYLDDIYTRYVRAPTLSFGCSYRF